eukprot:TRINITY_DN167_c0_g1_i1.p1 TRINITY_DN167_c0_g1~~TRINITY_DN167_c0_g1_i1.p1  ORF type:complete len:611 (+),score=121.32 TRINITY_DN167_c0_g1_i1:143-1975(+)
MDDELDQGIDYYGRKSGKFKLRGQRCKELGGLRKTATDCGAFLPDNLDGFIFLERDGPVMDYFYAKHTKEASKLKRKKFYRIVHFVEPLLVHWRWLLSNPSAAQSEDELKKAEKLLREVESFDIDIVSMDISQDGETPFYRKGNMEWDQGYVRMRVRDNNSLPHWLRRRWMSTPGKPIMDDDETEELASNDDRAGVNEKNLPVLWRKWPRLPHLLTDALFDKVIEIENAGGPAAYANRLYGAMAAADARAAQANGDAHNNDDMHVEVAPEIAFINFLERAASASPHPSRSNTPAPYVPSGYASPPPAPQSSLLIQSPQLQNPLSPFSPGVNHHHHHHQVPPHPHVMPPPQQHLNHHQHNAVQNPMMQSHMPPSMSNGTPILSPRPVHAAGAAPSRFAAAVAASPSALEPPSKRRKLTGSSDDKMTVDSMDFGSELAGASGLITPSQFFAPDTKPEPSEVQQVHPLVASHGALGNGLQTPTISINGVSEANHLRNSVGVSGTPLPLSASAQIAGAIPLPSALVDSTVASPVSPLAFANIMQQYFQHVSSHITAKETENAALQTRVKKLRSALKKSRRAEQLAKTTVRFLRMHPNSGSAASTSSSQPNNTHN